MCPEARAHSLIGGPARLQLEGGFSARRIEFAEQLIDEQAVLALLVIGDRQAYLTRQGC